MNDELLCSAFIPPFMHSGIHPHPHSPPHRRFRGSAVRTKALSMPSMLPCSAMHNFSYALAIFYAGARTKNPESAPACSPLAQPADAMDPANAETQAAHQSVPIFPWDPSGRIPSGSNQRLCAPGARRAERAVCSTRRPSMRKRKQSSAMQWKSVLERFNMEHPRQQRHRQE
jgi:hypothetical protein